MSRPFYEEQEWYDRLIDNIEEEERGDEDND